MKDSGDVFVVLGWGLRKYAWVVAMFVLALGVLIPRLLEQVPDEFEAHAQVGPSERLGLPNLDPLPRLGQSVFYNGVVAEAVRESVEPPLPRSVNVIPERVELVAAQDNIVFTVTGRGPTAEYAQHVANVAAAKFTEELNKYSASVGSFAIQRLATPPGQPVPKLGGALAAGIGVLAGLAAGVGIVALLLVWRRPVVAAGHAEEVTGAPVLGRVLLSPARDGTRGLPQLCHRLLSGPIDMLLLAGPHDTRRARRLLTSELTKVLGWTRSVVVTKGQGGAHHRAAPEPVSAEGEPRPELHIIAEPSQVEVATRSSTSLTLLVVREGVAHSVLRRQAEQYLDDGVTGVVLVRTRRVDPRAWWERLFRSQKKVDAEPRSHRKWIASDPTAMPSAQD